MASLKILRKTWMVKILFSLLTKILLEKSARDTLRFFLLMIPAKFECFYPVILSSKNQFNLRIYSGAKKFNFFWKDNLTFSI